MHANFLAVSILIFVVLFSCVGIGSTMSLIAACATNVALWLGHRILTTRNVQSIRRNDVKHVQTRLTIRRAM